GPRITRQGGASQQKRSPNVRFGSIADLGSVRFTPQSRQSAEMLACPLCANNALMQCSIKRIDAVTSLRWNSPYPRPTTRCPPVDFVLVGPIANNLDLDRSGKLPGLPLF